MPNAPIATMMHPARTNQPEWRNWQTRRIQNPVPLKGVWVRLPPPALAIYDFKLTIDDGDHGNGCSSLACTMKIVIPGGTGQVGAVLCRALIGDGHDVVTLGRSAIPTASAGMCVPHAKHVQWDGKGLSESWTREIDDADVIINLAGRSVNCRYTDRNRREIMDSRIDSTRAIGAALARARLRQRIWLQASTATIYAHRIDGPNDEHTGIIGGNEPDAPSTWKFSIDVATAWEKTATEYRPPNTRLVLMRSAMTMSPDWGGIFDTLLTLVRRGLGGTAGNGRQYISWIHERDFIRAMSWLIERGDLEGPVNLASPNPLPNRQFMRELRSAASGFGAIVGLPATKWMLELGAIFMRTETELILKSRRVVPSRLLESGFIFEFPHWPDAARELCARARSKPNR
jgi:uncharacterized protein (TIGR01777 family)